MFADLMVKEGVRLHFDLHDIADTADDDLLHLASCMRGLAVHGAERGEESRSADQGLCRPVHRGGVKRTTLPACTCRSSAGRTGRLRMR